MTRVDADVLIVGGGVAGAVLALALGRKGRRVIVLERAATPALNGADVLKPAGIAVLRSLGLLESVLARGGRKRTSVQIFHDGTRVAELDYRRDLDEGNYFILAPYALVLTSVLEALKELPEVTYLTSQEVTSLQRDGSWVMGMQTSGRGLLRARYYVGADGAMSWVRAQIGIEVQRQTYAQKLYFAKFPAVASVDELNRLYVDSSGALAYFYPVGFDAFRAVLGFEEAEGDRLVSATAEVLQARVRSFASQSQDAVAALTELAGFARIPVARMHAAEYGRGNVALLGDAIHNVHPITGQGMNLSIEDAGELACCLDEALEPGARGSASWLERYRVRRWPINEAVVQYGHGLCSSLKDREQFIASFDRQMQASRRGGLAPQARQQQ